MARRESINRPFESLHVPLNQRCSPRAPLAKTGAEDAISPRHSLLLQCIIRPSCSPQMPAPRRLTPQLVEAPRNLSATWHLEAWAGDLSASLVYCRETLA